MGNEKEQMEESAAAAEGNAPEANFMQFLSGMAMQSLMQLGLMSNPMNNETNVDLVQAKYSIDLLGIIQEKTKGNLNDEEEEYLKTMLTQLRLGYVDAVKRKAEEKMAEEENKDDAGADEGNDTGCTDGKKSEE